MGLTLRQSSPLTVVAMKKNQSSESGLFNARLVVAISLTIIGVSLTMMSLASTPSSGTLTDLSGPQTYTAGPFFQPNAFGNSIAGEVARRQHLAEAVAGAVAAANIGDGDRSAARLCR